MAKAWKKGKEADPPPENTDKDNIDPAVDMNSQDDRDDPSSESSSSENDDWNVLITLELNNFFTIPTTKALYPFPYMCY